MSSTRPGVAAQAANAFMTSFVSTRKMNTPLKLPNDSVIFPSSTLPPCMVRTVEVEHSRSATHVVQNMMRVTDILINHRHNPLSKEEHAQQLARDGEASITREKSKVQEVMKVDHSALTKPMSMAFHRIMTLVSLDMHNYPLLFDRATQARDPLMALTDDQVRELRLFAAELGAADEPGQNRPRKRAKGNMKAQHEAPSTSVQSIPAVRLGASEVQRIQQLDPTGLAWRFATLAPFGHLVPTNKLNMCFWALSHSPVMTWGINKIMQQMAEPQKYGSRTLVLVDSPYAQL